MLKNIVGAIVLFCLVSVTAEASPLRIATGEYPPLTTKTKAHFGLANRIISRAAIEVGIEAEFAFLPWRRALEYARNGTYTASSYWHYKAEREKDFIHVGPLLEESLLFFSLKNRGIPAWSSLEDLGDFRIGATLGYTYSDEFWKLAEEGKLKVEVAKSDTANIKKLLHGRIDLFVSTRLTGWHLINEQFSPEDKARLTTLPRPLAHNRGYLLVSRKTPNAEALAASLQQGVDAIRDMGLIERFTEQIIGGHH